MSEGRVVVIVEDERDLLKLLCYMLEDEGYRVIAYSDPTTALTLRPDEKPAVFLVDMMMPVMQGIELAHRWRDGSFPRVPMIGLSASTTMLNRAQDSGLFQATVAKPFEVDRLLEVVANQIPAHCSP
jgi:CheY-like chemotaxis protein